MWGRGQGEGGSEGGQYNKGRIHEGNKDPTTAVNQASNRVFRMKAPPIAFI